MALAADSESIIVSGVARTTMPADELVRLPEPATRKAEQQYRRRYLLAWRERRYCLFNGHFLQIDDSLRGGRQAVFNLAFLEPRPVKVVKRPRRFLIAAGGALVLGVVALLASLPLPGAAFVALACLSMVRFLNGCVDRLVFISRNGRVPLFYIDIGGLSWSASRAFAATLSERADGAGVILPPGRARMAAEEAEHRRLQQAGSLSTVLYQRARQRIFASFGESNRAR